MSSEMLHRPGEEIPVEVLADSADTVAREGEAVALVGETQHGVQVELVESESDRALGMLTQDADDFQKDSDTAQSDYSSGDSAGYATMALFYPVYWMKTDSGYDPSQSDYVKVGDGGDVEAYTGPTAAGQDGAVTNALGIDGNGNLENPTAGDIDIDFTSDAFPFGFVFTTLQSYSWAPSGTDRVAVVRGVL